ncbi:Enhancer of split mgamma protein [Harpegnathos saltator]|uniref:Enhancer of split mgamma protein n=1 Tax=Harpegnathos saltator TaxID=610380 RepID=E2B8M6_HARSA|nr:Enhancer of split mgamma protein [Harpegnathos saltator]
MPLIMSPVTTGIDNCLASPRLLSTTVCKITKPLLERKRRARINRCLDELKNIMVDALETERENISKLEKADILELTVRHLQRLQAARPSGLATAGDDGISAENRWQRGFGHCAAEACRFLSSLSGEAAGRLARHLASGLQTSRQSSSPPPKINLLSPGLTNRIVSNESSSCTVDVSGEVDSEINRANVSPITSTSRADNKHGDEGHGTEPSTTVVFATQCRASMSPVNDKEKLTASCSAKLTKDQRETAIATATTTKSKSCNSSQDDVNAEDDEEIDVERVEERNTIWRPW